jgi:hypothetical protein
MVASICAETVFPLRFVERSKVGVDQESAVQRNLAHVRSGSRSLEKSKQKHALFDQRFRVGLVCTQ